MTGENDQVEALRGRLVERVRQQVREIEEATGMSDMRATERLLDVIAESTDDPKVEQAVRELRRRGDTIVRRRDLRSVLPLVDGDVVDLEAWSRLDRAQ